VVDTSRWMREHLPQGMGRTEYGLVSPVEAGPVEAGSAHAPKGVCADGAIDVTVWSTVRWTEGQTVGN
jgi:hypothetical protein